MSIRAVLFDADGVLQRRPLGWRETLQRLVGPGRDPDGFLREVFSAEIPALSGGCDFAEGLAEVARRWELDVGIDRLLEVWTDIHVERGVAGTIRSVRERGVLCCLATNQEEHKARYMSEVLGYRELFDREFYSFALGIAKPAAGYFAAVAAAIGLPPGSLLLVDDRAENVEAARGVGMRGLEFCLSSGPDRLRRLLREQGIDTP